MNLFNFLISPSVVGGASLLNGGVSELNIHVGVYVNNTAKHRQSANNLINNIRLICPGPAKSCIRVLVVTSDIHHRLRHGYVQLMLSNITPYYSHSVL